MLLSLVPLSLVLQAASISPATVPAKGAQEAIITLDKPGRVIIKAQSPSGTSCSLVDHVRGPFASSGRAGTTNCTLDELLDAGTYKLRLSSRVKGKGQVALSVTEYKELNPKPVRLEPRREVKQKLNPGEQASFWLKIDKREPVSIRVSGRNVGDLRLWKNGQWLDAISPRDAGPRPIGGQPIYEWWLETQLEPGVYLLTAYGAAQKQWTDSSLSDDNLIVSYGFQKAPVERYVSFTLPVHGLAAYELPEQAMSVFLTRDSGSKSTTRMSLHPIAQDGSVSTASQETGCVIDGKARIPDCSAYAGNKTKRVALVRGDPGTRVTLQWAPLMENGVWADGAYGYSWEQLHFDVPATGEYLVAMHETPVDSDSAPMGCILEENTVSPPALPRYSELARDVIQVAAEKPFKRAFNYDGNGAVIWFDLLRTESYLFATSGGRKNRCELFRIDGEKRTRLTQTEPKAETCRISYTAAPGKYELRLYGGIEGIETLTVAQEGLKPQNDTPTKTGCTFPRVKLSKGGARVLSTRATAGSLRALYLRPLPLQANEPLSVVVDGKGSLTVPVAAGKMLLEVRALGGESFTCTFSGSSAQAKDGRCTLPALAGELKLDNPSSEPISFSIRRASPPPPPQPALQAFSPNIAPLPVLQPGAPLFFDFDRDQSRSVVFDVKEAGLYHVQTLGLLATNCTIRTPVVESVGAASGGGRGRNCLVSTYLRPGRYLFNAQTAGQSKGRAGMMLERRGVKAAEYVSSNGQAFFRAEAGDLIQQKLKVSKSAEYTLSTAAQAGSLLCRLDDPQGWPALPVPMACTQTLRLSKGTYLWTQLPITVESMRRTSLERVRTTPILKGNKAHDVAMNAWHRAELGGDGKDEFLFEVSAKMNVSFALTHGMQGRLLAIGPDRKEKAVEVIAPMTPDLTQPQQRYAPTRSRYQPPPPPESYEDSGEGDSSEGESSEGEEESPPEESYEEEQPQPEENYEEESYDTPQETLPSADAPAPIGRAIELAPGKYRLVTEHSKGDVAITYALYLRTDVFAPGITQLVDAPGKYALTVPTEGTLRVFTRGDTDVRCRLFDKSGALITENSDRGADWNCAFAEPVPAGDYDLVLESQTQTPGPTKVSVILAKVTEAGGLISNAPIKLSGGVSRVTVTPPTTDSVQEVSFTSKSTFSCALENARGEVRARQTNVKTCTLLYRSSGESYRVRLWTLGGSAQVVGSVSSRAITAGSKGSIGENAALKVSVASPGRYKTSTTVYCVSANGGDLLRRCGPETSLDAGEWIFSAAGGKSADLPLDEVIDSLESPKAERQVLSAFPTLLRQNSSAPSIHLMRVSVQVGDRGAPACRIVNGVAQQDDYACFATSDVGTSSVARWWTTGSPSGEATISRQRVALPGTTSPLILGFSNISWSNGSAVRLGLPAEQVRVNLSLPAEAWAVQLSDKDTAVDLCTPSQTTSRCVLTAKGGSIIVHSPNEPQLQAEVVAMDEAPRRVALSRLYEANVPAPGQLKLALPANSAADTQLRVTGAMRCMTTLGDGTRVDGCSARIPKGQGGEVTLDVQPGGVRAVLAPNNELNAAMLNASPKSTQELSAARAQKLSGALVDRVITVPRDGVIHLRSDTGVCGLVSGSDVVAVGGGDQGCALDRMLKAGSYKLVVRGFADRSLAGNVSWTHEPVKDLAEGIAKEESFIAPTQTRFFRFSTQSPGRVGLGLQVSAELLECAVLDAEQRVLGDGCQQFLQLDKGTYLLAIHAPSTARTLKFKPVLVGLAGAKADVPEDYLRDFFNRIGVEP